MTSISEIGVTQPSTERSRSTDPVTSVDVSIVIPSYNRAASVVQALDRCLALNPRPREIIIVDDHSDDVEASMLSSLAQGITRCVRLPANGGPAVARSVGFESAQGKYLLSLDDDSWLLDDDALRQIWDRFEKLPTCGILALRGFSPGFAIEPSRPRLTMVADHMTCGAAYRAEVLHRTGYHLDFLRYMSEEADLGIKVIDAGFDIILDDSIRFFHDYDPGKRTRASHTRVRQLGVRNDLLQPWVYFPLELAIAVTLWRVLSHLVWGIRHGAVLATLRGYLGAAALWPRAVGRRAPVRRRSAIKYLALRRRPRVLSGG